MSDWTGTGTTGAAEVGSYINIAEADEYAAVELDAGAFTALTDIQKAAVLAEATEAIDAIRWAGSKYVTDQDRQWPRLIGGTCHYWDTVADEAAVPAEVKRACFLEALDIVSNPARRARLNDRHDGVGSQSSTGNSENYTGPPRPLCRRAHDMLRRWYQRGATIV